MSEYINKKNALNALKDTTGSYWDIKEALSKVPTADVRENVHGKWRERCEIDGGYGAICNICGEYCSLQYTDDRNFCPNCGADMRTKDEV